MTKIITVGLQKGGVSKTTTSGILSYILSQNHNVLAIDMDSQGNLSQFLSDVDDVFEEFEDQTVLEGIKSGDVRPFIHKLSDTMHLLPANDYLATISQFLYRKYEGNPSLALKQSLQPVMDDYDYIIIDTPPSLSEQTINALSASTHVLIVTEASQFSFRAIDRFLDMVEGVKERTNPDLKELGILRTLNDSRRTDSKAIVEIIAEEYDDLCFDTIIQRRAATGRLAVYGFFDNPELSQAIKQYKNFVKEVIERV
ncbi:ParA family protein [Desertibacillus haloalkaliphilus]|uniref:ParA family protein n=1 Tax=Desertibacillus haloalkaliphilus TaxID=1328930 RepID=UPI001C271B37|nr:ParA family protein [Desertibacillus haloalkaliphilus]MBU8908245.1 ParA family protein [Desertibacillus haloalkaliphilus]